LGDKIALKPVLSWRAKVSEVKEAPKGSFIGYDLVERLRRKTRLAIIPIGYWHGFPRSLSGIGTVLIRGKRARVLGRVSMDIIVVDANGIPVMPGDKSTIIGRDGKEELSAFEVAQKSGTIHYEFVTRINPLIERIVI
jgi:alanine racemase